MQLNIDMSPPTNIITLRLGFKNHLTFDLHPAIVEEKAAEERFQDPKLNCCWDLIFGLVSFGPITDRRPDRRKAMCMSPPCIRTGGLKNVQGLDFIFL